MKRVGGGQPMTPRPTAGWLGIALPANAVPPILFDNQTRSGKTVIDRRKYSSDDRGPGRQGTARGKIANLINGKNLSLSIT
jgi:hypothetical protein